jgi:hypothetical protein
VISYHYFVEDVVRSNTTIEGFISWKKQEFGLISNNQSLNIKFEVRIDREEIKTFPTPINEEVRIY